MPRAKAGLPCRGRSPSPSRPSASQQTVKDLVANLKELKVDSQVNLKLDDTVRKDKQLDAAHAVHVVAWKGADKKVDDTFGKCGPAGQLVVVADKPDIVWAAKGYSSYLYTQEAKDCRDKEIFKFDDANAAQVTIDELARRHVLHQGRQVGGHAQQAAHASLLRGQAQGHVRAYKALTADDFGDGKSLADAGLDKPEATVTISLKDGAGTYTLLVGKTSTGSNRWAKKADSDAIFSITNFSAEWATSDASKFQAATDAGAPSDAGKK